MNAAHYVTDAEAASRIETGNHGIGWHHRDEER